MAKIDKSLVTKEEWRILKERRRREKAIAKIAKNKPEKRILNKSTAFVIGNGTSRRGIDLEHLKQYGAIYGCNALYREFEPDYLVAVDVKMIVEINKSGYQHTHEVWTNQNKAYEKFENLNFFKPSKGWSSGPTALWLASQHGYEQIIILGFDYQGLDNGKRVNNLYADTTNYKKSTEGATFYGNWLRQTDQVIKENPHINYRRIILPDNFCPPQLNNHSNFKNVFIEDFKKMFSHP